MASEPFSMRHERPWLIHSNLSYCTDWLKFVYVECFFSKTVLLFDSAPLFVMLEAALPSGGSSEALFSSGQRDPCPHVSAAGRASALTAQAHEPLVSTNPEIFGSGLKQDHIWLVPVVCELLLKSWLSYVRVFQFCVCQACGGRAWQNSSVCPWYLRKFFCSFITSLLPSKSLMLRALQEYCGPLYT